jgi:tripartite-type tricarboxylate transporter receptor subunit TctC
MSFIRAGVAGVAALTLGAALAVPAQAEPLGNFYKNRTITILVGYGAGGTYGRTSLLLGKHLGKVIPGNPTIVVQHMPGAGGIKAANYAYNAMPKQGYNVLMPPEMSIVSELLRPKKVKFKTKNFTWLGRVFGQNTTVVVRRDTGVKTLEDAMKKQVIVASSGKGSPTFLIPTLLNALVGTKFKIVTGYKGSRKMQHAMEQNEARGVALGWTAWISAKPEWFRDGDKSFAIPLVQSGFKRQAGIKHVRMIREVLANEEDIQIAEMLASASMLGRGLVLPPGAPKKLVAPLRAAFAAITKDKAFIKDAYKRGLEVDPISGADIQKKVNQILAMSPATVKKARALIFPPKKK